jgi:hypothetical protein
MAFSWFNKFCPTQKMPALFHRKIVFSFAIFSSFLLPAASVKLKKLQHEHFRYRHSIQI